MKAWWISSAAAHSKDPSRAWPATGQLQRVASLVGRRAAVGRREQEAVAGLAVASGDPHLARNQAVLAEDPQQAAEEADAVRPADLEIDEAAALGRVVDVEGVEQQGRRVGRR